jgi:hypothetical protein
LNAFFISQLSDSKQNKILFSMNDSNEIIKRYCNGLLLNSDFETAIPITKEDLVYSIIYGVLFIIGILANMVVMVTLGLIFQLFFEPISKFFILNQDS